MSSLSSARALLFLLVAVAVAFPDDLRAEPTAGPDRVAMAADLRIFHPGGESDSAEGSHHKLQQSMRRGAEAQWRAENDPVELLTTETLQEVVTTKALYDGTLDLAREWGQMGVEAYNRVQTQEAIDYLERSLQNFETISHDLVAPAEVAEILMYLALSYLEEGTNVMRPIELLQQMVLLDPTRQLERGYYPDFVVQYYESARDSLWRSLRNEGPDLDHSRQIAGLLEADYVFHGYALPAGGDWEMVAYLYDAQADELLPAERLEVDWLDEGIVDEGFGRLASRLAACLTDAVESDNGPGLIAPSHGTSRLSVELGVTYGSFLQVPRPLNEPFGNYGLGIGVSWSVTREFEIYGSMAISNSLRDYSGRLRDNFTTIRGLGGARLGRRFGPVYLGLGAALEMARVGTVRAITDPNCIPEPDQLCPGDVGTAVFDDHGLHLGLQLRPRLGWVIAESFQVWSTVGLGYYIAPLDGTLFNFPLVTEFGVNYRF